MTMASNSQIIKTILLFITVVSFSSIAYAKYGGGTGEPNDPYLIYTAEQLYDIGTNPEDWGTHFKLMDDIDLSNFTKFHIIGRDRDNYFSGSFDGNGHIISNLTHIETSGIGNNVGLFGYVRSFMGKAIIKDLGLIDPNIDSGGGNYVGSLVGQLFDGTITDCYVMGGSVSGGDFTGGLVGGAPVLSSFPINRRIINCYCTSTILGNINVGGLVGSYSGTMTNCYFAGNVGGYEYIGGLLGESFCSQTSNCYSTGMVLGIYQVGGLVGSTWGPDTIFRSTSSSRVIGFNQVGGLVGLNIYGEIFNCYSTGSVLGISKVAGLVGVNQGTVNNCYSTGIVEGTADVGGLIGSLNAHSFYPDGDVSNSFWDIETSEQPISAGGIGKITAEMQAASTFLEAGWDFVNETTNGTEDIWRINEGQDRPHLCWEKYGGGTGELNNPYLIYTAEEMNQIGLHEEDWDKHFKLMADIDMGSHSETEYHPIGFVTYRLPYEYASYYVMEGTAFTGMFDGNSRKIRNFSCHSREYAGLFGVMGYSGVLKNLTLVDPNVSSENGSAGVLVSSVLGATIRQCHVQNGTVSAPNGVAGGLVGGNGGDVLDCSFTGRVLGCDFVGGLIGDSGGTIACCFSIAEVSGEGPVGGLVGRFRSAVDGRHYIRDCYSRGRVTGTNQVGGLVGLHEGPEVVVPVAASLFNCYSASVVTGMEKVGGLIGEQLHDAVSDNASLCWDIQTSTQDASAGGIGRTTGEMQMSSTFINAGWDFVGETENGTDDIWWIDEGQDYPKLWWELGD